MSGLKAPTSIAGWITTVIGVVVITNLFTSLFPTMYTNIVALGSLENFSFSGLFANGALGQILISVLGLVAVLAVIGVKMSASKR